MTNTRIRWRFLGLAVMFLAAAGGTSLARSSALSFSFWLLAVSIVVVSSVTGTMMFLSSFLRGTFAIWRMDVFLPFLRKKKKNQTLAPDGIILRWAKRVLPSSWFADRTTGRPGLVRKWLKRLGPSVLSAPFRRCIQIVCLLLFFALFFIVCWPYTAEPAAAGNVSANWRFVELEQETGDLRFERDEPPEWPMLIEQSLYIEPAKRGSVKEAVEFQVTAAGDRHVVLRPVQPLSADLVDAFLIGTGLWSMTDQPPNQWPSHYTDELQRKEFIAAESFLVMDPLVGISTGIAARSWVWSLACAGTILIVCVLIPRGFCGYLCPLGTVIDFFDWAIAGRVKRFQVQGEGWWVHIKYYLLAGVLLAAACGVLLSGIFAAIPIITRAMLFLGEPVQTGLLRRWDLIPPMNAGHWLSILLFAGVLMLGFLRSRFWCKYVCPSGAVFSIGNLFRITERKVESTCINCNKCVEICPFDAIKPDFTTRVTDCTLCQTCGGVCPTHAIKFVDRWNLVELKVENDPPTGETAIGRRGFLSLAAGSAAAAVGGIGAAWVTSTQGAHLDDPQAFRPVRPPGSVPEPQFLQMCIRCGECYKACPNNVLQAEGFEQGLEGLWAPLVNADWAGCESSCNACGQVCPTGAIRALPLEEKKVARMGLAIVNESTCLPFAGKEDCDLCVVECRAAGYDAIEYRQVHTQVDADGQPIEGTGFLAPVVLEDKCVGCGLCQTRCYAINVKERHVLAESAIVIEAGEGKEDRLMSGSYLALREQERRNRQSQLRESETGGSFFVPPAAEAEESPFGTPPSQDPPPTDESPF